MTLRKLDSKEMVLNNNQVSQYLTNLKERCSMSTPTKYSYDNALEVVKKYEKRQAELQYAQKELSFKLKQFSQVKFKVDKKSGEIIFSGLHKKTNKLLMAKTVCDKKDIFEASIGKLIATKKALQEDISDIIKLVEEKPTISWHSGGIVSGSLTVDSLTAIKSRPLA
jgi:hypothetical protein